MIVRLLSYPSLQVQGFLHYSTHKMPLLLNLNVLMMICCNKYNLFWMLYIVLSFSSIVFAVGVVSVIVYQGLYLVMKTLKTVDNAQNNRHVCCNSCTFTTMLPHTGCLIISCMISIDVELLK